MPVDPKLEVYEGDRFAALIRLFKSNKTTRSRIVAFGDAVLDLLSTPLIENSSERLSHLIDLIDYCKPVSVRHPSAACLRWICSGNVNMARLSFTEHPERRAPAAWTRNSSLLYLRADAAAERPFEYLVQCRNLSRRMKLGPLYFSNVLFLLSSRVSVSLS